MVHTAKQPDWRVTTKGRRSFHNPTCKTFTLLNRHTLHYRRMTQISGNMIETYKILTGKYDMVAVKI